MKISFHGAAQTVTGSKHLVETDQGKKVLLDCGMFQGLGADTIPLNNDLGFDAAEIDYVILSHAHIDHSGLLPKLVKEGYQGSIYCTQATAALVKVLLVDSAHIQESDVKYANKIKEKKGHQLVKPLYSQQDALDVIPRLHIIGYEEWITIDEDIKVFFTDAGHILGSACVHLQLLNHKNQPIQLTFSGDIGRYSDTILKSPRPFPQADYIIMESTYGDKLHPHTRQPADLLLQHITQTCLEKKGKLIIPAFSVGRTQELLYALNQLELENRLPDIPYYLDSPMSVKITMIVKQFPELYNQRVQQLLKIDNDPFAFKGLHLIEDVNDSKALNFKKDPCVIISASGMAEAGRVKHHIANNIEDPRNTVLLVGYCEPLSLGGRLKAGAEEVGIFGINYPVNASIENIDSLSAHADYDHLSQWLSCQDEQTVRKIFLVHGEADVQQAFKQRLLRKGYKDVVIPRLHETIGLGL